MLWKKIIASLVISLMVTAIILLLTIEFSGLGFFEALTDMKSISVTIVLLALSAIALWVAGKLPDSLIMPHTTIKKAILPSLFWTLYFAILFPCYLLYGYFSYYYLVHSELPPKSMYNDISQVYVWFTGHYVLMIVFAIVLFVGLLLKTLSVRAVHFSINWVMKTAGHDVVELSEDEFIEAQKMIIALEKEKRSDQD